MIKLQRKSICRTCEATESNNFHHLNERIEDYPEVLADMLQEFITIDLPDDFIEKLPQYICDGCTRRLLDAHDFRAQARDATEHFLQLLNKEEQDPVETIVPECIIVEAEVETDKMDLYEISDSSDVEWQPKQHKPKINRKATRKLDDNSVEKTGRTASSIELLQSIEGVNCDICEKPFKKRAKMLIHRRTHTGERPFKCDLCGKSFNRNDNMKAHKRSHTIIKPFKCDLCGKTYSRSDNLKAHQRNHTVKMKFQCDLCEKTFNRFNQMKMHRITHTDIEPAF